MVTGASFQHSPDAGTVRPGLRGMFALTLVLVSAVLVSAICYAAPQSIPSRGRVRSSAPGASSKSPSPFLEAEALLRQGSVDEAKKKIQEQLALNPGGGLQLAGDCLQQREGLRECSRSVPARAED